MAPPHTPQARALSRAGGTARVPYKLSRVVAASKQLRRLRLREGCCRPLLGCKSCWGRSKQTCASGEARIGPGLSVGRLVPRRFPSRRRGLAARVARFPPHSRPDLLRGERSCLYPCSGSPATGRMREPLPPPEPLPPRRPGQQCGARVLRKGTAARNGVATALACPPQPPCAPRAAPRAPGRPLQHGTHTAPAHVIRPLSPTSVSQRVLPLLHTRFAKRIGRWGCMCLLRRVCGNIASVRCPSLY